MLAGMATVLSDEKAKKNLARNLDRLMEEHMFEGRRVSNALLAATIGVSAMTITYYLQGERMAGSGPLARMAEFFGVSTDFLLSKPKKKNSRKSA